MIVEFPKIHVRLKRKGRAEKNFLENLGFDSSFVYQDAIYAFASGIETRGKFLGATIDAYAEGARKICPGSLMNNTFLLNFFITKLASQGLVYGIHMKENKSVCWSPGDNIPYNGSVINLHKESSLETEGSLIDKVESFNSSIYEEDESYNWQKIRKLLFVPSQKFTQQVWGFKYDQNKLSIMKHYHLPEEQPTPIKTKPKLFWR